MQEIRKIIKKINGWLSDKEGELLYTLAKNCKGRGVIVEIGSWKGKSTIWLGKGSKAGNRIKIYAIDPHTGSPELKKMYGKIRSFEEFKDNIKNMEVDDIVVPIIKTSEAAAKNFDEPVELIFIDGSHEYEIVKLDFELWFPKLINGGIMAFHDTNIPDNGPRKVIEESVYKSKKFRNIRYLDSVTFAEKAKKNSMNGLRNRYAILLRKLYELGSRLHLPKPVKIIGKKIIKLIYNNCRF